ncbi:MAG: FkbM family methyltransferase [Candidatus Eremiobacteraeota bacterium]|nr:FkbM family methyltransferase [Candidatus Eremiobacteraeota bacterium]
MTAAPRFYGQFNPPVDRVLYERYFSNSTGQGFFVECGAFDGQLQSSCKFFEESLGWRGINIEASPPIYAQLVRNRPLALNLHCALGATDGEVSFTHVLHPDYGENFGNGSIHHLESHRHELLEQGCTFQEYTGIPLITYRHLMTMLGLTRPIALMVLDVEGGELDAIAGMVGSPALPQVLCVEIGHLGRQSLIDALAPLGYRYDFESFVNAFFVRPAPQ